MIVEIDARENKISETFHCLGDAVFSAYDWLKLNRQFLVDGGADRGVIGYYDMALKEISNVEELEELNEVCEGLIDYYYEEGVK